MKRCGWKSAKGQARIIMHTVSPGVQCLRCLTHRVTCPQKSRFCTIFETFACMGCLSLFTDWGSADPSGIHSRVDIHG